MSAVTAVVATGVGARRPRNCSAQARVCAHAGKVQLDYATDGTDDDSMVVHVMSLERQTLSSGGDWELIFDTDGVGAVFDSTSTHRSITLDNLFRGTLWRDVDGKCTAVCRAHGTRLSYEWSLTEKMHKYFAVSIKVPFGVLGAAFSLDACGGGGSACFLQLSN